MSGTAPRHASQHFAGLDGLRGLAVTGVLLFHANQRLRGGYLGVDLFFVLSGFLITSILMNEWRSSGTIDLKAFWIRRARRLLPALLALIPAIAIYAKTLAKPDELASLRADGLATLGYVANWRAIFVQRSYWEMFASPSPLEHTWSLAIEEQFYVVWPLLVVAVMKLAHGRVRAMFMTCVVLCLASCAAMLFMYDGENTTRVYLGTDTRGAAILVGAALATSGFLDTKIASSRWMDLLGVIAAIGLGVAWVRIDGQSEFLYRGGFWLTELACVILVVCCVGAKDGIVARALSIAPLRAMGVISYGIYLWHWPVYVVLTEERAHLRGWSLLALRIAVTLAIAAVSYRFLERPIRQHGLSWGRPIVVVPSAFALAIIFVLASTRSVRAKAPIAPPPPTFVTADMRPLPAMENIPPASELPPGTLRILLEGDSVALSLGPRMRWAQDTAATFVAHRSIGDCSILEGYVPVHSMSGAKHGNGNCARHWADDVAEVKPDVTAILLGGAFFSKVKVGKDWRGPCDRGWHDAYAKRLVDLLNEIAPNTKRRVVMLTAYPVAQWQTPTINDDVDCYNRTLSDAAHTAGAETLDLNPYVCPHDRECNLVSRDALIRPDGLHYDGIGAEDTARWVLAQLHPVERDN